ncbi:hypothetical protein [Cupriavidus sp. 2SB]|uniref:hypothetical protein n=1 Tax=Cupriavidus sp. 2SB TaxID=2502199 RepID=UPI0010F6A057|nr:hypothetical protein [Cupriavidus sp. 2SB]
MPQPNLSLTELASHWEAARLPTAETARQMRVIAHDLGALSHVSEARALTPGHLRAFRNDLLAHYAAPTARKMFGLAHALLAFGYGTLLLDTNPARGMTVALSSPATRSHAPFTPSELTRIFTHRVFTTRELPLQCGAGGVAAYWLPLILLCTGVRLDTAAALRTDHLRYSADTPPVPYWQFEHRRFVLSKSYVTEYLQPIHPILCRLGLLDYVAALPPGSDLFPLLPPDRTGRRTARFSTYFHRFLHRDVGIVGPGKGADSFRYTFALACRQTGLPVSWTCAVRGIPVPNAWRSHFDDIEIPLVTLQRLMVRLSFPGFPL